MAGMTVLGLLVAVRQIVRHEVKGVVAVRCFLIERASDTVDTEPT